MSRIARIVPTTVLTIAALALVAPAAQARPTGPFGESPIVKSVVVTTGDKPLANPVQLPQTLGAGLLHASTVQKPVSPTTPVAVPDSPSNGFDWTAAAIGAGAVGILMLMLAAGVTFRRRGQLAA
jgi:hypothetical protein